MNIRDENAIMAERKLEREIRRLHEARAEGWVRGVAYGGKRGIALGILIGLALAAIVVAVAR